MRPMHSDEANADKTLEGDWEYNAVKSPCKKGCELWKIRPDMNKIRGGEICRTRTDRTVEVQESVGKRGPRTATKCEVPSLELNKGLVTILMYVL